MNVIEIGYNSFIIKISKYLSYLYISFLIFLFIELRVRVSYVT